MKKITALLLAVVLGLLSFGGMSALAVEQRRTLLDEAGVRLILLKYELIGGSGSISPYISLSIRGVNNTDHRVWVDLKDINVNGVSVIGTTRSIAPHTDTGESSALLYSVRANDVNRAVSEAALANARTLDMRVAVQDGETYKDLADTKVSIDFIRDSVKTAGSSGGGSSWPSGGTTYYGDYKELRKGSKGQAVRELQLRLIELGYMDGKADGSFGKKTIAAVRSFCSQNNLAVDNVATPDMQAKLFSSSAKAYSEPWIPLEIGQRTEWKDKRGYEMFSWRTQVVNNSKSRTIKGFELEYYITDVWGKRLLGSMITRKYTVTMTVKPGQTVYTPWAAMGFYISNVDKLYLAITKIAFADGEVREVYEPDFYNCSFH